MRPTHDYRGLHIVILPHLGRHRHIPTTVNIPHDWFAPLPTTEEIRRRRHTDVSKDPRYNHWGLSAAAGDEEFTAAPSRIPDWVLPHAKTQMMFKAGHGTTPNLTYARGVPNTPSFDPTFFDKKKCTLILVEIGFCTDLGCDTKFDKIPRNTPPLSRPLEDTGEGWSLSPSLPATLISR